MGQFSIMHLLILFGIILLFFGGRRLPEIGGSMGRAIREFKDAISGKDTINERTVSQQQELLDAQKKAADAIQQLEDLKKKSNSQQT